LLVTKSHILRLSRELHRSPPGPRPSSRKGGDRPYESFLPDLSFLG